MRLFLSIRMLLFFVSFSVAAQSEDPEWPCVQVLVPNIVTGVYWPNVIEESEIGTWEEDESLVALVNKLGEIDEFTDDEKQLIEKFAVSMPLPSRTVAFNKVADGLVTSSNTRRSRYISGIKKYTRQQISIAGQIETTLNYLAELDAQPNSTEAADRVEIEETLHWHQRVYDQREHAIPALCDRPVELEENLSAVLRELAQYLP